MIRFYVKFWTDRWTDRMTDGHQQNNMSLIFRCWGTKSGIIVFKNTLGVTYPCCKCFSFDISNWSTFEVTNLSNNTDIIY